MSAEDGDQKLRARVQRLETLVASLEDRLHQIVALITGIAYLITYHFGELGMFVRVVLGYLLSAGLGAFGLWLADTPSEGLPTCAASLADSR